MTAGARGARGARPLFETFRLRRHQTTQIEEGGWGGRRELMIYTASVEASACIPVLILPRPSC